MHEMVMIASALLAAVSVGGIALVLVLIAMGKIEV